MAGKNFVAKREAAKAQKLQQQNNDQKPKRSFVRRFATLAVVGAGATYIAQNFSEQLRSVSVQGYEQLPAEVQQYLNVALEHSISAKKLAAEKWTKIDAEYNVAENAKYYAENAYSKSQEGWKIVEENARKYGKDAIPVMEEYYSWSKVKAAEGLKTANEKAADYLCEEECTTDKKGKKTCSKSTDSLKCGLKRAQELLEVAKVKSVELYEKSKVVANDAMPHLEAAYETAKVKFAEAKKLTGDAMTSAEKKAVEVLCTEKSAVKSSFSCAGERAEEAYKSAKAKTVELMEAVTKKIKESM